MIKIGIHTGEGDIKKHIKLLKSAEGIEFTNSYLYNKHDEDSKRFAEFITDIEAVFFLNYHHSHYKNLVKCLKTSKNIFIESFEKISDHEAKEILKLVAEANVVFKSGLKYDFYSSINNGLKQIHNPALINIVIGGKKLLAEDEFPGIIVFEFIYQFLKILNANLKKVIAKAVPSGGQANDVASIILEFDNGSLITFCLNVLDKKSYFTISVYKHQINVEINMLTRKYNLSMNQSIRQKGKRLFKPERSFQLNLKEFIQAIHKKDNSVSSVENWVKTFDIVNKIGEKIRISSNQV